MSKRQETASGEGRQSMQPAQKRRRGDRVEVNVGGTSFHTAASTLTMHSSYFQAQFSPEWLAGDGGDRDDGDCDGPLFLDQDPEDFATLLAFMRVGHVRGERLSAEVLFLAEFLGMRRLLDAVKCMAYCNSQPYFAGSFEDAVAKFDEECGSITEAVQKGILPSFITERKEGRKVFAKLVVIDKADWHWNPVGEDASRGDLLLEVCVPENDSDPPQEGRVRLRTVPDCHFFLDALNWLHRNGFTNREEEEEKMNADDFALEMLLFSKERHNKHLYQRCPLVIVSDNKLKDDEGPKEFAAMITLFINRHGTSYVEADVGTSTEVLTSQGPVTTHISRQVADDMTEGYNWLQKEGYSKKEESLSVIYQRIKERAAKPVDLDDSDDTYEDPPKVAIFSRPLQRQTNGNSGD